MRRQYNFNFDKLLKKSHLQSLQYYKMIALQLRLLMIYTELDYIKIC